jgi:hypothetical protein
MKTYLIQCRYEYYCQGYEETFGYFLVYAKSFEEGCNKLSKILQNAHNFENMTIE